MNQAPKDWELVQQRVFTKWVNSHLRKRSLAIQDLIQDLKNGVMLINLFEIIAVEEKLAKWYAKPVSKFHAIANLNIVLDRINSFVAQVGIKVQFGSEQIHEGDRRQILGMIWCLIHKFEISDISEEELSAKDGLLLWCQKKTKGYNQVNVKNFSDSWEDGLAFAALIHKHRPDLIDFDSLKKEDRLKNLQLAFDVADKQLDIPPLLDAQDMVNYKPDDKAVMTYVAYFWKKFSQGQKADKAAKRIGNAAKKQKEIEDQKQDYANRAAELVQWIGDKTNDMSDTDKLNDEVKDLDSALSKNSAFKNFKTSEKPEKQAEKNDLELLLTSIRSKQKAEGIPPYQPPENISPQNINQLWDNMTEVQDKYDRVIRELVNLMRRLDVLLARFRSRSAKIVAWQVDKSKAFQGEDVSKQSTISGAQARVASLETQNEEIQSIDKQIEQTNKIGQELLDRKHKAAPEVENTMGKMGGNQTDVKQEKQNLSDRLNNRLAQLEDLNKKCLEFAKKAEAVNLGMEDAALALIEPVQANSVSEVEEYETLVAGLDEEMGKEHKPALGELKKLESEISQAGGDPQTYVNHTTAQLGEKVTKIETELKQKKQELVVEKKRQIEAERLLTEYAKLIKEFNDFNAVQKDVINSELKGSHEDQLAAVKKFGDNAQKEAEKRLQAIAAINTKLEEMNIAEKADTSLQMLTVVGDQLKSLVHKRLDVIEQQIMANKDVNLTPEQLQEIRDTFNHFDKDKDGYLTKLDFKACLASIGEDLSDSEIDKKFTSLDIDKDNKIKFDEFIEFFVALNKEGGTGKEEVLNSFRQVAGDKEFVTENEIRAGMEKEQAEYLLSKMPKLPDGNYDYKAYVQATYA